MEGGYSDDTFGILCIANNMLVKTFLRWVTSAAIISSAFPPLPAFAQTQAQQDRLNQISQFAVTSSMCEDLGMEVATDLDVKVVSATKVETSGWGIDQITLSRLINEATDRQLAIFSTDLQTASSNAKTEAQLRALPAVLMRYGRLCIEATHDPIFSKLIVAPKGFDLIGAANDKADLSLEKGGLASWQSPQIQARGDLMMLAGACRSRIGASRSDALVREFGQSDIPRVRDYYSHSFDEGLADPTLVSTLTGCNRKIAVFRAKTK